jgi:hypothetical protein
MNCTKVSLYDLTVFELAPLSLTKYLVRKSVRYLWGQNKKYKTGVRVKAGRMSINKEKLSRLPRTAELKLFV